MDKFLCQLLSLFILFYSIFYSLMLKGEDGVAHNSHHVVLVYWSSSSLSQPLWPGPDSSDFPVLCHGHGLCGGWLDHVGLLLEGLPRAQHPRGPADPHQASTEVTRGGRSRVPPTGGVWALLPPSRRGPALCYVSVAHFHGAWRKKDDFICVAVLRFNSAKGNTSTGQEIIRIAKK